MSFFDYFRKFLGVRRRDEPGTSGHNDHYSHRDSFRNPIWQNDEDDDDDIDDFRHPGTGMHFSIFSDPIEMTRYFESQMDSVLKNFFGFDGDGFSPFSGHKVFKPALPFEAPNSEESLRDKMLKSKPDFPVMDVAPNKKIDTDLDGKITTEEFLRLWNNGEVQAAAPAESHSFSFGRSVKKEIVRRPDGSIEEKRVITDSEGNQETTISKEVGDKKYLVTIKKDTNGIETKSEDFINMDESELEVFKQKWKSTRDNTDSRKSNLNQFPWEKFFGPNPKL